MIKNFLYLVITFIPTWLFLLVWHYASPNTFWQRFVILIVGAFFAVLQILCLCIAAYTSFSRFCNEELGKSPDKSSEVQTIRIGLFRPINKEEAVVAVKEGVYDLVVIIMTRGQYVHIDGRYNNPNTEHALLVVKNAELASKLCELPIWCNVEKIHCHRSSLFVFHLDRKTTMSIANGDLPYEIKRIFFPNTKVEIQGMEQWIEECYQSLIGPITTLKEREATEK